MDKNRKNKGYLLLEILICLFLFSVLVFVVSVFLKRIVIIEKRKKEDQIIYENLHFTGYRVIEDIKNRSMEKFLYESISDNIHVRQNEILLKKEGKFYKLEHEKGKLYVSDGNNIMDLGKKTVVGKYDKVEFKRIDKLLVIILEYKNNKEIKILNLF
ncbi:hypothetical protein EII29_07085 [Leptotrichia sp. OH3620_COT-345]|uniref:prepilin-type N-terminal cleavage/methylation domain-containing protein n=1 Tax=Leptotrichia sp. OH3620_COT-345 TaxID=2491048 RepID=UPI000F64E335|nr:prepilin-type N-terminal cleavage/methylation domain-containing protein [Leptotrichia sp. OH3620_COT-345]RRD39350.1 hypothetical protein EII29_07085 [Leptotrichia sp. OH3620_COT-345]